MPPHNIKVEKLKLEIKQLEEELSAKKQILKTLELNNGPNHFTYKGTFSTDEIVRYSRQMLVPMVGTEGQILLKNSKVLIVGVGGLGCPAAFYLAAAGIGEIVLVDYDEVELSNLHRQILHSEPCLGMSKVESASQKLNDLNKHTKVVPIKLQVNSKNIEEIVKNNLFSVIIDGSDNVATRYLLNDVAVLHDIPLVSGSALQIDGQLTVYHYKGGPCYRCVFPEPPPVETVASCGDAGVLGAVPGVIGILQALEAIKVIVNCPDVLSGRFLMFDGSNTKFREVKLRQRNADCKICGDKPTITSLIDYEQFCGSKADDKVENINILKNDEHVDVETFSKIMNNSVVLDVRPGMEYEMCNLTSTVNFPYPLLTKNDDILDRLRKFLNEKLSQGTKNVYVLCRRGNDSQRSISFLKEKMSDVPVHYYNVKGGLHAYAKHVDSNFPVY